MLNNIRFVRLAVIGLLAFGAGARAEAQTVQSPESSVPSPQIAAAKSVFIMNAGSENPAAETAKDLKFFSGGPDRAYNEFFAAMKNWGRFTLVPAPADADLIVEVQYALPPQWIENPNKLRCEERCKNAALCECSGTYVRTPQLDLIVRDGKTHAVLRTFTRLVEVEKISWRKKSDKRQRELDRNFDGAMNSLVSDFGRLARGDKAPAPIYLADVGVAPTPNQITSARKVWIARARPDSGRLDRIDMGPTSSDLAYNTFYALIKNGGRFEIADSPAAADLILQISSKTTHSLSNRRPEWRINLTVVDTTTGTGLWTVMQNAARAILARNDRRIEQETVAEVVNKLTGPAGRVISASAPEAVDTAPPPILFSAGQKVFIANAVGHIAGARPGDIDQAYNDFHTGMKKWGRFELVSSPGLADMIFELSSAGRNLNLRIVDTRTRTALLDLAEASQDGNSKKSAPEDLSETVAGLLAQAAHSQGRTDRQTDVPERPDRAPAQLAAAKTVFIAFPQTSLNANGVNIDELYYKAFSEPGRWGRFRIAPTPAQTDMIADLDIEKESGTYFRLTFRDPKTRAVLWAVKERLEWPWLNHNLAKSVQKTIDALMNDAREVVGAQAVARSVE